MALCCAVHLSLHSHKGEPSNHQNRRQHSKRPPLDSRQQTTQPRFEATVKDILDDYVKNRNRLKPYQVGLVWNKLGKALQQSRNMMDQRHFWVEHEPGLQLLVVQTLQSVNDFNGQSTATVTHSLAKLISLTASSNLARVQSLWNALLVRTEMHLKSDTLNAHSVSNLLWAYAKADKDQTHKRLLVALSNNAIRQTEGFNPQGLANMAWAFAKLNHESPSLLDAIARSAVDRIDEFNPQELSNIALGYATLNHEAPALLDAIARSAVDRIDGFNPQGLANIASAFAKLNHEAPALLDCIARSAVKRIDEFNPQEHANMAWAFAKLNHETPALLDCIARSAVDRIDEFNPQELSNMAWAYATLNHEAPSLLDAIARSSQECIDEFNPQGLANTAWAFAVCNIDAKSCTDSNSFFARTLLAIDPSSISFKQLSQLHQFHLWCKENNAADWFSDELKSRCRDAFVSPKNKTSRFQEHVVASLGSLPEVSQVQEEVRTKVGYSLDAFIVYRGDRVGVEIDGPSHFVGRSSTPTGSTVLKHRQLRALEGWKLISIAYREWDEICDDASLGPTLKSRKQAYLRNLLDEAVMP
jgi:hypothetical protein